MRFLHLSDIHFGTPSVPERVAALERWIAEEPLDAIVISGDLTQRQRRHEMEEAARFVRHCERRAPTVVIPGNHDCAWWTAPLGIGSLDAMWTRYRGYVRSDLEPRVQVPGATIVSINSAHGLRFFTLTTRLRDLSVVGAVREAQWDYARNAFSLAPEGDLKVLVFHHNLLTGPSSHRWGLASRALGVVAAAETGADVVCCGHDHEERVEEIEAARRRLVVSCASTISRRTRAGRPPSFNVVERTPGELSVALYEWVAAEGAFERARTSRWART